MNGEPVQKWHLINNGQYMITADTCPRNALVTASALDCSGRNLPPCIGKLTIVLPASMPKVYLIKLKLIVTDPRLETLMNNFPREHILHDINLKLTTHTADIQHGDVQDSRSLSYLETPLKKLRLNGILLNNGAKRLILYFENLAEEGLKSRFEECQRRLNTIANQRHPFLTDVVLVVLMEKGLMAYLQGDLREAENIYLDVCKLASRYNSTNYHFIVGRAHSRIASVYIKLGKLSEALEHLETSSQVLECVSPCEHTSDNRYNMAALHAEKLLRDGYTSEGEEIGKYFEESISHLRNHFQQYSETSNRGIRRVANKEIMLYLKSDSRKAPDLKLEISQVSLARAAEKIERFKRNLLPDCPRRDKAVFYGLESDYLVHKRELSRGLERARQCLSIAEELGLASELAGADDRIKLIESLLIRQSVNAL